MFSRIHQWNYLGLMVSFGGLLILDYVYIINIDLSRKSIFPCMNVSSLCLLKNQFILSKLSNLGAQSCYVFYCPLDVHGINSGYPFFILDINNLCLLFFFFLGQPSQRFINFIALLKNQLMVSLLILSIDFLFLFSFFCLLQFSFVLLPLVS